METASQYEVLNEDVRENPLYYYNLTKNVLFMEEKLCFFQKYSFFTNMNQIYIRIKKKFKKLMMKDVELWVKKVYNLLANVGVGVNKILKELMKGSCIFDALGALRRCVITKRCLSVLYGSRRIGIDSVIIDKINIRRKDL